LHGPGGRLGVERVGLAVAAAARAVWAVDLDHRQAVVRQEPQQPCAEAAGALHADLVDLPERLRPHRQLRIAASCGREALGLQQAACRVKHRRYMHVGVSVHADRHHRLAVHTIPSLLERNGSPECGSDGQHRDEGQTPGSYQVTTPRPPGTAVIPD
jgi:hypothetical protein